MYLLQLIVPLKPPVIKQPQPDPIVSPISPGDGMMLVRTWLADFSSLWLKLEEANTVWPRPAGQLGAGPSTASDLEGKTADPSENR